MWLFLAFVAVPIIEIALFIQVGGAIGLWPTLGIVVLTALVGTWLARTQGLQALARLQRALAAGADPVGPLADGAAVLVAGVLLLTPGFFTDALGLVLLVPALRSGLFRLIARHVLARATFVSAGFRPGAAPPRPDTIEGEFTVLDEDGPRNEPRNGPGGSGWTRR
jgi:UPF0716 protein FxsA